MTLSDAKRKVMMLLDEYSNGGEITYDEDIDAKMNDFFDIAQRDVAVWQPIVRRAQIVLDGTGCMALGADVARVLRMRRAGAPAKDCEVIDGKLCFPEGDRSSLTVDYIAAPQHITPQTPDEYEFEVSEEAANCLPFFVAAQHLIADLLVDYGAFYSMYLQMRGALSRTSGGCGGALRQNLYRRE